jgi:hypothetical protein
MVGGGALTIMLILWDPGFLPNMPLYYIGWFGLALGTILLVGISFIEGEEKVPHSFCEPAVTDGGDGR